ncbi:hypothetical protein FEM48_Zijuj05G0109600 [Ziziphus jujuba var. spinosa]|uniref:Uncharacterized protein n=1 Tax=Ziziphus jujuba var. spinosa TaxID=714518 RepID=A0A978VEK0_ZIZJJ|nr:hypothetical protein FEM48_Zijuj05G0109600 [Ziziphus jujuba var. spinosa]
MGKWKRIFRYSDNQGDNEMLGSRKSSDHQRVGAQQDTLHVSVLHDLLGIQRWTARWVIMVQNGYQENQKLLKDIDGLETTLLSVIVIDDDLR